MSPIRDLLDVARNQRTAIVNVIRDEYESPVAKLETRNPRWSGVSPVDSNSVSSATAAYDRTRDWLDSALDWAEFRTNRFDVLYSTARDQVRAAGLGGRLGPMLDEFKAAHDALVRDARQAAATGQNRIAGTAQVRWLDAFQALTPWTAAATAANAG
jgi:hypothetical protein